MTDVQTKTPNDDANEAARIALIAEQNDRFRTTWGADFTIPGQIVMTRGVAALSYDAQVAIMVEVMQFKTFTEENDPHGTRDFGIFTVTDDGIEVTLYWKIDLYDAAYQYGSEDCTNPAATRRVLTIMHPHEY